VSHVTVCITNHWSMNDVRSCTVKGKHTEHCDGFEHRLHWEWDPEQRKEILTIPRPKRVGEKMPPLPECQGCLPRLAEHGLLCWMCWEKVLDALKVALDMITHLRSVERGQQVDNQGVRGTSGWVLPVPATWRTADELIMLLGHPAPGFPSDANVWEIDAITERYLDDIVPELWVSSMAGAEAAVRFYRLMQTAMHAHPMREYEHRIRNVRCYKCRQLTLLWKPPLEHFDDIHVECTNPRCGAVIDQTFYERLAILEESAPRRRRPQPAPVVEEVAGS
jgi:hypothetical protein